MSDFHNGFRPSAKSHWRPLASNASLSLIRSTTLSSSLSSDSSATSPLSEISFLFSLLPHFPSSNPTEAQHAIPQCVTRSSASYFRQGSLFSSSRFSSTLISTRSFSPSVQVICQMHFPDIAPPSIGSKGPLRNSFLFILVRFFLCMNLVGLTVVLIFLY